jgi:hypothetical protein
LLYAVAAAAAAAAATAVAATAAAAAAAALAALAALFLRPKPTRVLSPLLTVAALEAALTIPLQVSTVGVEDYGCR